MRAMAIVIGGLLLGVVSTGCAATGFGSSPVPDTAPMRGFSVEVVQAISNRVPLVSVKTCGNWGCEEQDVDLHVGGPSTPLPCTTPDGGSKDDVACGVAQLDGPGPGFGYAPLSELTTDPVTVTVRTPAGAKFPIDTVVQVRPRLVCPSDLGGAESDGASLIGGDDEDCSGGAAQANLLIGANGLVRQVR